MGYIISTPEGRVIIGHWTRKTHEMFGPYRTEGKAHYLQVGPWLIRWTTWDRWGRLTGT